MDTQLVDSLCPHPVVSDTVPLTDCHVVHVGLEEPEANPENAKLNVFPNPATQRLTVRFPRWLVHTASIAGMTVTTVYRQWNRATLLIADQTGRTFWSQQVSDKTGELTLDVSAWRSGIYFARLVYNGNPVAGEKFIVKK